MRIVPFSEEWMEGYLDLAENDDSRDPLYHKDFSREEAREKVLWQVSRGATKAHLVAVKGGKDIQTRVHIGFKNEEDLYREVGFEFSRPAALWRKSIAADGD